MISVLQWIVFVLYAMATVFSWRDFLSQRPLDQKLAHYSFLLGIVVHFALILMMVFDLKRVPIATLSEAMGTFVWMTAVLYWVLETRLRERSMRTLLLPIFLLLIGIANLTFERTETIREILYDVRFEVHTVAMLLGYAAFVLSFIASLLYLQLTRELQEPVPGVFFRRLPNLAFFERISDAAVNLGLVFTMLGFIWGLYYGSQFWSSSMFTDPKILAVELTWLIYGLHFLVRRFAGWRGRRAAVISLIGFTWVLFSFLIISTLIPSVHHFN